LRGLAAYLLEFCKTGMVSCAGQQPLIGREIQNDGGKLLAPIYEGRPAAL
jgi:hypothetical protein